MIENYIINLNKQSPQFTKELLEIRKYIIDCLVDIKANFEENIKWNSFNFTINSADRITFNIPPKKYLRIIFHLGSKKLDTNVKKNFDKNEALSVDIKQLNADWADNNRLVITFDNFEEFINKINYITNIISFWAKL